MSCLSLFSENFFFSAVIHLETFGPLKRLDGKAEDVFMITTIIISLTGAAELVADESIHYFSSQDRDVSVDSTDFLDWSMSVPLIGFVPRSN